MKKVIRLTESDLHRIIKESVKRVLREDRKFDMRAWDFNNAFRDAESLEDLDDKMNDINQTSYSNGEYAADNHPSRINPEGSFGSHMYTHPNLYSLKDIENRANRERDITGFPS